MVAHTEYHLMPDGRLVTTNKAHAIYSASEQQRAWIAEQLAAKQRLEIELAEAKEHILNKLVQASATLRSFHELYPTEGHLELSNVVTQAQRFIAEVLDQWEYQKDADETLAELKAAAQLDESE